MCCLVHQGLSGVKNCETGDIYTSSKAMLSRLYILYKYTTCIACIYVQGFKNKPRYDVEIAKQFEFF